jgi:hypothetical protein
MTMPDNDEIPGSYADSNQKTVEFQALLKKYDNDFEKATAAQLRGEKPDPDDESSTNLM